MCDTTYAPQQDADNPRWPMLDTHPNRLCQFEFPVRKNTLLLVPSLLPFGREFERQPTS